MTFLSLFSGIGGLDLGLERAGMRCIGQVEIDPFCRKVLAKHWPNVPKWSDIREFHGSDLDEKPDLIAGGDPCQANSNVRRSGTPATSPAPEFVRVIKEVRPRFVLRENPSQVRADAPWPWWNFRWELEDIGYAVVPFRLRACCFGFPHERDRLFLLGEMSDPTSKPDMEALASTQPIRATWEGSAVGCVPGRDFSAASLQLRESDIVRRTHGIPNFMERHRACGNAVVPQVAEWIGRRIMEAAEVGSEHE